LKNTLKFSRWLMKVINLTIPGRPVPAVRMTRKGKREG